MVLDNIEKKLVEYMQDYRIDGGERQDILAVIESLEDDHIRYLRNKAFLLVRERIANGEEQPLRLLSWLEKVVKIVDNRHKVIPFAKAYFSPGAQCRNKIMNMLETAKRRVDVCVFTISDDKLSNALVAVHKRGVPVRIISDNDKADDHGNDVAFMQQRGVALRLDNSPYHMHHKFALIDEYLVNGSFNWTRSATEKNQENILVSDDSTLYAAYQEKFDELWGQYQP